MLGFVCCAVKQRGEEEEKQEGAASEEYGTGAQARKMAEAHRESEAQADQCGSRASSRALLVKAAGPCWGISTCHQTLVLLWSKEGW